MHDADGIVEIRTTFASAAAADACAARLVERRLAACVQVDGPVRSTYRWQGAVERAEEFRCTVKTTAALADACVAAIRGDHAYENPEILVAPASAPPPYAAWVRESVGPASDGRGAVADGVTPGRGSATGAAAPNAAPPTASAPPPGAVDPPPGQLYDFFITLHALHEPAEAVAAAGPQPTASAAAPAPGMFRDGRGCWPVLGVPRPLAGVPLAIGFDDALARLSALDRLFAEPDGSFVWTSPREGQRWQVDGNLFERDGRVLLADIKGTCPPAEFDRLLGAFGWPGQRVMMELTQAGVFFDETTFRRHASQAVGTRPAAREGQG